MVSDKTGHSQDLARARVQTALPRRTDGRTVILTGAPVTLRVFERGDVIGTRPRHVTVERERHDGWRIAAVNVTLFGVTHRSGGRFEPRCESFRVTLHRILRVGVM